ncbi:MAG: hypothetical protein ABIO29_01630 [Sphingomicrobium sp.]
MQISQDPNVWIIYALVFLLGLMVGLFMTAGGRKKWKTRYYDEITRRETLERTHGETEREWRERDSLRDAAVKDRSRTATTIDRDGDGIADRDQGLVNADPKKIDIDGDGIDDRREV